MLQRLRNLHVPLGTPVHCRRRTSSGERRNRPLLSALSDPKNCCRCHFGSSPTETHKQKSSRFKGLLKFMNVRCEKHNTTFHATRAYVRIHPPFTKLCMSQLCRDGDNLPLDAEAKPGILLEPTPSCQRPQSGPPFRNESGIHKMVMMPKWLDTTPPRSLTVWGNRWSWQQVRSAW